MKRISGKDLVKYHFPEARRITAKRLRLAVAREVAAGWHACYVPCTNAPDRLVVFIRDRHPLCPVFDAVLTAPDVALPLGLVEQHLGARIDTLVARDRLSTHGLIIKELTPGTIKFMGGCPRLARVANFPRYGMPNRGWKVRHVVPAVLGLPTCPQKLHDDRRLQTALVLDQLGINGNDICEGRSWVHLVPKWTIRDGLGSAIAC